MKPKKNTSSPKHMRRSIGRGCRGGGDCVRVSSRTGAHSICKSASTAVDAAAALGPLAQDDMAGSARVGLPAAGATRVGRRGRVADAGAFPLGAARVGAFLHQWGETRRSL